MAETPPRLACIEQADKSGPVPLEVGGSEAPGALSSNFTPEIASSWPHRAVTGKNWY